LQALKSGDLDGLVLWSPVLDRAVVEGYGYYPPCCDIGKTEKYGAGNQILAANTDFLKDRDLAVRFLKVYSESLDFYVKNPDKAVNLITEYTGQGRYCGSLETRHLGRPGGRAHHGQCGEARPHLRLQQSRHERQGSRLR